MERKITVDKLFSTPLLKIDLSDKALMNESLCEFLLAKESSETQRRTGGVQKSNVAGWRSKDDLLQLNNPQVNLLATEVSKAVGELMKVPSSSGATSSRYLFQMYAWANVNRRGAYNVVHTHPNHHWAGVYYVRAGTNDVDKPLSGLLEFSDPRPGAGLIPVKDFGFGDRIRIQPRDGLLVIFPGWLPHFVHPYDGDDERISIAFNIKLEKAGA